jgi:hypothetical protein
MWRFDLPSSVTNQFDYFYSYAQAAVGNVDGANISVVDCSTIPMNSDYAGYNCIDVASSTHTLTVDSSGDYN